MKPRRDVRGDQELCVPPLLPLVPSQQIWWWHGARVSGAPKPAAPPVCPIPRLPLHGRGVLNKNKNHEKPLINLILAKPVPSMVHPHCWMRQDGFHKEGICTSNANPAPNQSSQNLGGEKNKYISGLLSSPQQINTYQESASFRALGIGRLMWLLNTWLWLSATSRGNRAAGSEQGCWRLVFRRCMDVYI